MIGQGATASVFLAQHTLTNMMCAIKMINLKDQMNSTIDKHKFLREIEIMKSIENVFIVKIYDYYMDDNYIAIVMEYCERGTLLNLLMTKNSLDIAQICIIFSETVSALICLHKQGIIHRDIKLENILLDRNGHVRVSDFGLARTIPIDKKQRLNQIMTICGSPMYASPEMVKRSYYDEKTDIWSVGVVLYAMIYNTFPFQSDNIQQLYRQILFQDPFFPYDCDKDAKDLILKLLDKDPSTRIELKDCFSHSFLKKYLMLDANSQELSNFSKLNNWKFPKLIQQTAQISSTSQLDVMEMIKHNQMNSITTTYRLLRDDYVNSLLNTYFGNIENGYALTFSKFPGSLQNIQSNMLDHNKLSHEINTDEKEIDHSHPIIWKPFHNQNSIHSPNLMNSYHIASSNYCSSIRRKKITYQNKQIVQLPSHFNNNNNNK